MEALELRCRGISHTIVGRFLEIHRGAVRLARLDLCPQSDTPTLIGEFRRHANGYRARLNGGIEGWAVVEEKDGLVSYSVQTDRKHFDKLIYFPESMLDGDTWRTFIWAQRDRAWGVEEDVCVRIGDTRPDTVSAREGTIIDPGDYPPLWPGRGGPRVCTTHHREFGWWGICVPGPLPVCDTYFCMDKSRFSIRFDYLHPGCSDGFMPSVTFALPLADPTDPFTVMAFMWELSEPWRLEPGTDYEPTAFAGLALCHPWEAMQHAAGNAWAAPIPPAKKGSPMNSDFLLGLLGDLVSIEPRVKWHFLLPQGWFKNIGDFEIGENFGGEEGFRKLAEEFRDGGNLITVHERFHHFNDRSEIGRKHPEWAAALRPGRPKPYWSPNEEEEGVAQIMDVTREDVREHLKWQVKRFLSGEPGCLNMDGLQMTGDHWPSAVDYELADNDYGVGDLLAYKINRELLLYGKSIKPIALFAGTNNPLYGMTEDVGTTEDHLSVPIHTLEQLRLITNLYPTQQLCVTSCCTTRTKALTVWPLSVAVGRPQIDSPRAFADALMSSHWHPVDEADRRRMSAVLASYANSPRTTDTVNVPVQVVSDGLRTEVYAQRKRTRGRLAGFPAAVSLGSRTVVTYGERKAVVASTIDKTVTVPLPPGAGLQGVERLLHTGERERHEHIVVPAGVRLHVPDAAGAVKTVEIAYRLAPGEAAT